MEKFSLIETILWENGLFFILDLHMARLDKSAEYFGINLDINTIRNALEKHSHDFNLDKKYRTRLLVDSMGTFEIESTKLDTPVNPPVKLTFSSATMDRHDLFLSHKTTKRHIYDTELSECRKKGYFEAIFTNQDGEITEGCITNILVKEDNVYFTPPLSSGLLPGTYRQHLINSAKTPVKEKVLYKKDILSAREIFVINSVIKTVQAVL